MRINHPHVRRELMCYGIEYGRAINSGLSEDRAGCNRNNAGQHRHMAYRTNMGNSTAKLFFKHHWISPIKGIIPAKLNDHDMGGVHRISKGGLRAIFASGATWP